MKGSLSFDLNDAKFTQHINEWCTGRVASYIRPKSVQNWLKKSMQMCSVAIKMALKNDQNGARFFCRVFICNRILYENMNIKY